MAKSLKYSRSMVLCTRYVRHFIEAPAKTHSTSKLLQRKICHFNEQMSLSKRGFQNRFCIVEIVVGYIIDMREFCA